MEKSFNLRMKNVIQASLCQENASQRLWNHWTLGMINPQLSRVYWLDPLRRKTPLDFAKICTKSVLFNPTLCNVDICRMMRDVIEQGVKEIPESYLLGSAESYTQEEIDEVTDEWLGYLEPHLQMIT